ncbi:hypothetical protein [Streptomyces sp. NPDC056401]|uniref:hypothetical protein n=1 Tax=Streptomyces sp. NPDC056401 TaxID=3345809 RepID=UPI0035D58402
MADQTDYPDIIELAEQGLSAALIKEQLGLRISVRRVQQIVHDRLGTRPTRRSIERRNPLREAVVSYMEEGGLNRYYCHEGHRTVRPCAIRALGRDLDSFVFVCVQNATVADF